MEINLAKRINNKNCWGFITPFTNGTYTYQNDNDLGLDLDALDMLVKAKKVFICRNFYAYLLDEEVDDDGNGTSLEMAKLLLKECHKHIVPLTEEEQKICEKHWKEYF